MENNLQINTAIVEDSLVIRNLLMSYLNDPQVRIVGTGQNGFDAIKLVSENKIDVLLLDIEMPEMSGIEALPQIVSKSPSTKVIMVSSVDRNYAAKTLRAFDLGAVDYIEKPSFLTDEDKIRFKTTLIEKVKQIGAKGKPLLANIINPPTSFSLKEPKIFRPEILAIASSTGGPKALTELFHALGKDYLSSIPVVVTQHMPEGFTKFLADSLNNLGVCVCQEAESNMVLEPGNAYVARGGKHLGFIRVENKVKTVLLDSEPVNFCKPAADVMLKSLTEYYRKIILVVLTGMGNDGLSGAKDIESLGGVVLAQDEKSSVVWGMPGAVAKEGICSKVLPINQLAEFIKRNYQNGYC